MADSVFTGVAQFEKKRDEPRRHPYKINEPARIELKTEKNCSINPRCRTPYRIKSEDEIVDL